MTDYTKDAHALPYPQGADRVAVAADLQALAAKAGTAISTEGARVETKATELADSAYERAKWKKPNIGAGESLDDYKGAGKDGGYQSLLASVTATLGGLPPEVLAAPTGFILNVQTLTNTTHHELNTIRVTGSEKYTRNNSAASGWTRWERILKEGDIPEPAPPMAGFKVVPLAVTLPAGASNIESVAAASLRFPLRFGATATRWRLHIHNFNYRGGAIYAGAVNFTGLWFGPGSHATGAFPGAPARVAMAFSTPADGAEWVSSWINTPINANTDYLLSTGFTNAAGQENTSSAGAAWRSTTPASASVAAPAQTLSITAPFNIWIEAETAADTHVIAEVGSSGAAGVGSTKPVLESPLAIYARKIGALPIHYAQPGTSLAVWNDPKHVKWQQWVGLARPDAVLMTLGSNDVFGSSSLASIQADHNKVAAIIKDTLSPNLYLGTIPPRTTGDETTRRQMNTWLRTLPSGARDIFDFAAAVSNDDEDLRPEYNADGVHTNTDGSMAKANAITRPIVAMRQSVMDQSAGRVVKVWDYLNQREQIVYGDTGVRDITASFTTMTEGNARIRRNGSTVSLSVDIAKFSNAGTFTLAGIIPFGFRPDMLYSGSGVYMSLTETHRLAVSTGGNLSLYNYAGAYARFYLTWTTADTWPTALPGTAVGGVA